MPRSIPPAARGLHGEWSRITIPCRGGESNPVQEDPLPNNEDRPSRAGRPPIPFAAPAGSQERVPTETQGWRTTARCRRTVGGLGHGPFLGTERWPYSLSGWRPEG